VFRSETSYRAYNTILHGISPVLLPYVVLRMLRVGRLRTGLSQRLGLFPEDLVKRWKKKRWPWIHAVSVGEAMAVRSLLLEMRGSSLGDSYMISTVTSTGQDVARGMVGPEDLCFYLPLDYPFMMNRIVSLARPSFLAILETEIWPNLVRSAYRQTCPVLLVNGRISDRSFGNYMRLRFFFRDVLSCFSAFGMQTQGDADRIKAMGAPSDRVTVTGNVKFDSSSKGAPTAEEIAAFRRELNLEEDRCVVVAGSIHPGEENVLAEALSSLNRVIPRVAMIVAPRHLDRAEEVAQAGRDAHLRVSRRSLGVHRESQWIVLDTMGELFKAYGMASVVFMGKSLFREHGGGQNPIEPAALGKAVLMGPFVSNFRDVAQQLKEGGGLLEVEAGGIDFVRKAERLLQDQEEADRMGQRALQVVKRNLGAAKRTAALLRKTVEKDGSHQGVESGTDHENP